MLWIGSLVRLSEILLLYYAFISECALFCYAQRRMISGWNDTGESKVGNRQVINSFTVKL